MKETMEKDLADLAAQEEAAKVSFKETVVAKCRMTQANSEAIEAKTACHGEVISQLDEVKALKVQLEQELDQRKVDRTDAGAVILGATGQREKEEATFAKESGEIHTNIAAIGEGLRPHQHLHGQQLMADHGSGGRAQVGR